MVKFWQWNLYNDLMKEIDSTKYRENSHRFEEKYAQFSQIMNIGINN